MNEEPKKALDLRLARGEISPQEYSKTFDLLSKKYGDEASKGTASKVEVSGGSWKSWVILFLLALELVTVWMLVRSRRTERPEVRPPPDAASSKPVEPSPPKAVEASPTKDIIDEAVSWEIFKNYAASSQHLTCAFLDYELKNAYAEKQNGDTVFVYDFQARIPVHTQTDGSPSKWPDGRYSLAQTNRDLAEPLDEYWKPVNVTGSVTAFRKGSSWYYRETVR